jgi:hypothetical protein
MVPEHTDRDGGDEESEIQTMEVSSLWFVNQDDLKVPETSVKTAGDRSSQDE